MIRVGLEGPEGWRSLLERMLQSRFDVSPLQEDERPDVVVAFLESQYEAQYEALPRALLELTSMPLLIMADDPAPRLVFSALRAGARGVIPADVEEPELSAAIEAVAAGLLIVHPQGAEALLSNGPGELPASQPPLAEPLTPREVEVLRLLALGVGNKEIAARLAISEHTVKYHVASLMGKLGAGTRTEAVTTGLRLGLILL